MKTLGSTWEGKWCKSSFKPIWGGDLIETGAFLRGGGFFNLEMTMVSVLHEELAHKVEKLKYKKF